MPDDPQRYRTTLDHLLEGFQLIGRDWTYLYVNPAAATHGRSTPEALVGRLMWDAYPGIEQSPLFTTMKAVMEERVAASVENHFVFPDGSAHWFELRIEPVPEGIVVHSIDIEHRKKVEAELQRTNEELEARVAERTRELAAANRDLEAFGYTVSHDLRAPLRAVDGFSRALVEDCNDQLDEVGKKHVARIRGAAERMGHLIDDLLGLARLGRASITRADVDLSALARSVADELTRSEPGRHVAWRIAPSLYASCDPGLARIVIENLLGNAFKFTARTPSPLIEVRASEDRPGAVVIADNGAGFDMANARKMFRPFQRLHHERDFPGTGIGLATVFRIIEKHGGVLEAKGVVDGGATFTVWFGG